MQFDSDLRLPLVQSGFDGHLNGFYQNIGPNGLR